jgi:hypothetical protein
MGSSLMEGFLERMEKALGRKLNRREFLRYSGKGGVFPHRCLFRTRHTAPALWRSHADIGMAVGSPAAAVREAVTF